MIPFMHQGLTIVVVATGRSAARVEDAIRLSPSASKTRLPFSVGDNLLASLSRRRRSVLFFFCTSSSCGHPGLCKPFSPSAYTVLPSLLSPLQSAIRSFTGVGLVVIHCLNLAWYLVYLALLYILACIKTGVRSWALFCFSPLVVCSILMLAALRFTLLMGFSVGRKLRFVYPQFSYFDCVRSRQLDKLSCIYLPGYAFSLFRRGTVYK